MQSVHLPCLVPWFTTCVPERNDINRVIVDAIDHFIQAFNDDATICTRTVSKEWVYLSYGWTTLQLVFSITYPLHELLSCLPAEFHIDIAGNLP